jgi:LysM repeat protein
VVSGDTLSAIAGRYGTTVAALRELNNISDPSKLRVGQVLRIP